MGAAQSSNNFTLPTSSHSQSTTALNNNSTISTSRNNERNYHTYGHQINRVNNVNTTGITSVPDSGDANTLPRSRRTGNRNQQRQGGNRVFFLLHRTWAVIVTDKWQRARLNSSGNSNTNTTASTSTRRSRSYERSRPSATSNINLHPTVTSQIHPIETTYQRTTSAPDPATTNTTSDDTYSDLHADLFAHQTHRNHHSHHHGNHRHRRHHSSDSSNSSTSMSSSWSLTGSSVSLSSLCTCSQCCRTEGHMRKRHTGGDVVARVGSISSGGFCSTTCSSDFTGLNQVMSPNSEDSRKKPTLYLTEDVMKEKQRAPIYNPEDYALSLRKWGRRPAPNGPGLYNAAPPTPPGTGAAGNSNSLPGHGSGLPDHEPAFRAGSGSAGTSFRDYRNPMLIASASEMTLRQFGTVSELLNKLRNDLKLAYPSFVQEFVSDPLDGITLLLELLRAVQLSQTNNNGSGAGTNSTVGKLPPSVQRKALLDELACLQCILCCCMRYSESIRKLSSSSAGLFTLAVCIMSNVNKSRIIALQLLTKACESVKNDNTPISEALSTLRLRFGEPVRFRFLVGMLTSAGSSQGELLHSGLRFVNTFLHTCGSMQKRLYVQAELDQAGFDLAAFKKNISINSQFAGQIFEEMDKWEKNHIDVENLTMRAEDMDRENDSLRNKILLLERKVQILQEEKGILISLEQCLKERCSELQGEVVSLKSSKSVPRIPHPKRDDSTPAEDEGISSSERSITPEDFNSYNMQSETLPIAAKKSSKIESSTILDDEEEETTIEEVMEELRNIINDAETEAYQNEEKQKNEEKIKIEKAQIQSKIVMRVDCNVSMDNILDNEAEIIPSNLHPQPPRKTRSLVHLYVPQDEYQYNKEVFFENETAYTSDESSDSLLSASKYQLPRVDRDIPVSVENNNRAILNTIMDARERALISEKKRQKQVETAKTVKRSESVRLLEQSKLVSQSKISGRENTRSRYYQLDQNNRYEQFTGPRNKSKSLDRIDDGLDSMVDIVMTGKDDKMNTTSHGLRPKSDSGNVTVTTLSRSISNVFASTTMRRDAMHNKQSYENTKMFLPANSNRYEERAETRYYFPRLQEKKSTSSSFLIKRGHTNAGMYSGHLQHQLNSHHGASNVARKVEYFATSGSRNSSSKVTDFPSGLY